MKKKSSNEYFSRIGVKILNVREGKDKRIVSR
jgi:hypothetical protein